ncbi:MAG: BrnT family toxin, partial [Synergistaceae bacterium]|nr:BrnT family toxin [Synergistaceae bacterium]
MEFEWDENKNQSNIGKHRLSFQEAQEVFFDEKRLIIKDSSHSDQEERFFCI